MTGLTWFVIVHNLILGFAEGLGIGVVLALVYLFVTRNVAGK
jgi:hypothetical protein